MLPHIFCDDSIMLDLRYLVGSETFDLLDEGSDDLPYGIGYLLEVGHTPQRLSALYRTRSARDQAFGQLTARFQAWMAQTHTDEPSYE